MTHSIQVMGRPTYSRPSYLDLPACKTNRFICQHAQVGLPQVPKIAQSQHFGGPGFCFLSVPHPHRPVAGRPDTHARPTPEAGGDDVWPTGGGEVDEDLDW